MIAINTFLTVVIVIMTVIMGIFTIRARGMYNSLTDSIRKQAHILQDSYDQFDCISCNQPIRFEASKNGVYAVKKSINDEILWSLVILIPEDPDYPEYASTVASEITETLNNEL